MEYHQIPNSQEHQDGPKFPSSPRSALPQGKHWKAPTVMLSSLLAGFAFILGHHFFYHDLHHKPTGDAFFEQQNNTNIGTAFAFVVRMFLVISVATAYWQLFWHQVKAKPTSVATLDTLSALTEDAMEFLSVRTLVHFPILALLAVIIWLIPIAAVFPPGSLTVELSPLPFVQTKATRMSQLDFNKNAFSQFTGISSNAGHPVIFGGPRYQLSQVANAVASRGEMLNFPAPAPNSSYDMNFMAPALQCATIEGSFRDKFAKNISKALNCDLEKQWGEDKNGCYDQTLYLAFAPDADGKTDFTNTIGSLREETNDTSSSLYIASQGSLDNSLPWNFINCSLYNATYHIHVNFTAGIQRVDVTKNITHSVGYFSVFDIINSASANGAVDPITGESAWVVSTLNQFGYQALMDAFGRMLGGQISVSFRNAAGGFLFNTTRTSIMTTSLVNTLELANISQIAETCNSGGGFSVCNEDATNQKLNITGAPAGSLSLIKAAEQLFENITLSLFSNDAFLSNAATTPPVDVTIHSPQNRYVYTWWRLIAPYLAALVLTFLTAAVGLWAMFANGQTYSQQFSTILRTTRNADIQGTTLSGADTTGAEPLPGHIAQAKIDFKAQGESIGLKESMRSSQDRHDPIYG